MKNICIVCYYELSDSLLFAKQSLERIGNKIFGFPMHKYIYDVNDKIIDYKDKFIEFIINNKIEYVLWWFVSIDTDIFIEIKEKTNVKYILFNWDEPFNWNLCSIDKKAKYLDFAFVTCMESVDKYKKNGCTNAHFLFPAFSPDIHRIISFDMNNYRKYECDISFCCTNLYDDPQYNRQYIRRKQLVDDIYQNQQKYGYRFNIYGPDILKTKYPNSYKGYILYNDTVKLFNYSKINLCTHVISDVDGYINERTIMIGASGGLLLIDDIKGITNFFKPDEDIIILNRHNYIEQISNILNNYDNYTIIRKNIYNKCKNIYTYDNWAKIIDENINGQ